MSICLIVVLFLSGMCFEKVKTDPEFGVSKTVTSGVFQSLQNPTDSQDMCSSEQLGDSMLRSTGEVLRRTASGQRNRTFQSLAPLWSWAWLPVVLRTIYSGAVQWMPQARSWRVSQWSSHTYISRTVLKADIIPIYDAIGQSEASVRDTFCQARHHSVFKDGSMPFSVRNRTFQCFIWGVASSGERGFFQYEFYKGMN